MKILMASLVTCYPPLFIEEDLENGLRKPGMYFRTFCIVKEEKGMTEDEMVGWQHCLHEHEFEQALEDDGQRSLAYGSPYSRSHTLLRD